MNAVFTLINLFSLIMDSNFGFLPMLGSIDDGKSARTPLTLLVVPNILSCNLGAIDGGLVLWDK